MSLVYEEPLDQGKPRVLRREIHVNDEDTAIVLRVYDLSPNVFDPQTQKTPPVMDLSNADPGDLEMVFTKPDGTSVTKTATFCTVSPALPGQVGDGSDGLMEYRTESGFLDVPGLWRVQGLISLAPGSWASQIVEFRVHPNL